MDLLRIRGISFIFSQNKNLMAQTPRLDKWFEEVWNNKREDVIDELFSQTCVAHGIYNDKGKEITGPAEFKPFFRKFTQSFPDLHVEVKDIITDGDKTAVRCDVSCTHAGEPFSATDKHLIQPSQQTFHFSGMAFNIIKNGQLQEGWNSWDFLSLYSQMGVV